MAVVKPVIFDNDDDEGPISFKRASTSVKKRPTLSNQEALKGLDPVSCRCEEAMAVVNPVIFDNDDDEGPISFKRAITSVKKRPTLSNQEALKGLDPASCHREETMAVVNPVIFDNDDDEGPISFKRAITSVKKRPTLSNQDALKGLDPASCHREEAMAVMNLLAIFNNDDDNGPISFKRACTSAKNKPTLSNQEALKGLNHQLLQDHNNEQFSVEDGDGDQEAQKSEDHANLRSGNGGAQGGRPKHHRGTTLIPHNEETMLACVDLKREQASMKEKSSKQGQQYSISRCLEVLHGMDDVSDEIKVLASDVLKDATNREFFLCYGSRLRGLWLKKEVGKLGTQLPQCMSEKVKFKVYYGPGEVRTNPSGVDLSAFSYTELPLNNAEALNIREGKDWFTRSFTLDTNRCSVSIQAVFTMSCTNVHWDLMPVESTKEWRSWLRVCRARNSDPVALVQVVVKDSTGAHGRDYKRDQSSAPAQEEEAVIRGSQCGGDDPGEAYVPARMGHNRVPTGQDLRRRVGRLAAPPPADELAVSVGAADVPSGHTTAVLHDAHTRTHGGGFDSPSQFFHSSPTHYDHVNASGLGADFLTPSSSPPPTQYTQPAPPQLDDPLFGRGRRTMGLYDTSTLDVRKRTRRVVRRGRGQGGRGGPHQGDVHDQ